MARRRRQPATKEDHHRATTVRRVAEILNDADAPSRFAHEGACRHGLRSAFCLAGAKWDQADAMAAQIVSAALVSIGATRPTWEQGQPEHTQFGVVQVERFYCARCGGPMPEYDDSRPGKRRIYCSQPCAQAASARHIRIMGIHRTRAEWRAEQAAKAAHNHAQSLAPCEQCGRVFERLRQKKNHRYCSERCYHAARREKFSRLPKVPCAHCRKPFRPERPSYKYCSVECRHAATAVGLAPVRCEHCNVEFRPAQRRTRFCSRDCSGAARKTEQQCPVCLSIFTSKPSAKQRFCSRRCYELSPLRGGIVPSEATAEAQPEPEREDPPPIMLAAAE